MVVIRAWKSKMLDKPYHSPRYEGNHAGTAQRVLCTEEAHQNQKIYKYINNI